ncbi:MAG: Do family serine endopeptidase [Desulfuromonas sp.]|nr:Do family serine endopeptidase [Desulfuromonas sp.]
MKLISPILSFITIIVLISSAANCQTPDFVALTKQLKPAVVNISSSKKNHSSDKHNFFDDFFNAFVGDKNTESLGSGFLISSDGYILTNDHVVDDASEIRVQLVGGKTYPATVKGIDQKLDLALVKIDTTEVLPTVKLGSSKQLEIGEWVMAIGNPFGLEQTVTVGIVSAKGRVIGAAPYDNFIQTDASINPGNSGGPLFNTRGEVVGINTAIVAGSHGIGFAIPIDTAKSILPQLKKSGHVNRGWLGITIQKVSDDLAASFKLAAKTGALITSVAQSSPAQRAQLQRGDIILAFNNTKIDSINDLPELLDNVTIGDQIELAIFRNGSTKIFTLKVEESKPEGTTSAAAPVAGNPLGATTMDITPELQLRLGLVADTGVVITSVQSNGPAATAKLQPGDVILEFNNQPLTGQVDLAACLANATDNSVQRLFIQRGEGLFFTALRLQ